MNVSDVGMPYIDVVLKLLDQGDPDVTKVFGRHVHWGYWENPRDSNGSLEDFALASERMCEMIFSAINPKESDQILDVGCGFGGTISSLNERYAGISLTGVNIDVRQIERARMQVAPMNQNNITFTQGDASQLPIKDSSIDIVMAIECIFHFPSRARFFDEACRVLRPGGLLFVSDLVPTQILAKSKKLVLPWLRPMLSQTFGSMDNECTFADYDLLASSRGMAKEFSRDVTRNIMPTHGILRELMERKEPQVYSLQKGQNITVEWLCGTGLLRYAFMGWRLDNQKQDVTFTVNTQ